MQRNSTTYIVGFAAIVCVVCSFFVSAAAVLLKEDQDRNALLDKQKKVLAVSGLIEEGASPSADEVTKFFQDRISVAVVDMESGQTVSVEEAGLDTEKYNQQNAAKDPSQSFAVPTNPARVKRVPNYTLIYEVWADAEKTDLELRVLPVEGMGLWGTLYGFLAIDKDNVTIRGLTFYQHKETPGLGGEVDNPKWKALWSGRKAYAADGKPAIHVIKGRAGNVDDAPHEVDGLSGATITSTGVTNLLRFWLGDDGFGGYLRSGAGEGSDG